MNRKFVPVLLIGALLLSGCGSLRADREWSMELPAREETEEREQVSGIEEYGFSLEVQDPFFLYALLAADPAEEEQFRARVQGLCGRYGLLNCGLDGTEVWLSFIREDGSLTARTVDLRYGFFEDRMEPQNLQKMPCGVWTSPDGRRRIRETIAGGQYGLILEQAGKAPRPLLLPGGAEKAVYNSVQCLWTADGLHAFLRVLPWTAETAEWDADARAEEFLIAENESRAEDARGVYLLDCMKEEPEWERILEDSLPDFPGMLPAEDGSRLLFVTTGTGSTGDMECLSFSAETGWQEGTFLSIPTVPECGFREAVLREDVLTAVTSENDLMRIPLEESGQEELLFEGGGAQMGAFLPAEGEEPACLMLDADLVRLRPDGGWSTVYKGKRGETALKLVRDAESGSILILYLDSVVPRADGRSCCLECRLVRLGFR